MTETKGPKGSSNLIIGLELAFANVAIKEILKFKASAFTIL